MTLDLGAKVNLILSSLNAVNLKLGSINAVVVSLEQKLNKVQGRVKMLKQDQAKSKDAIKVMHDGLRALNTMVEASKTTGDRVKNVWFQKISIPPHGGSRNFLGVGGSKRDKFPKGRGVHKEFFFPEGLKCDRINTYVFFQLIQVTKKNEKFYP